MLVLTVCGSLRARSSNRALLHAYARLAPEDFAFEHFEGVGALPHFNPDADETDATVPPEVRAWRHAIARADAVAISTPEYAHALPGAFKNALDWLVSDPALAGKPVAILHVARGSTWALDSLREVLRTMSTRVIEAASVSLTLGSNQLTEEAILAREDWCAVLRSSLAVLARESGPKSRETT